MMRGLGFIGVLLALLVVAWLATRQTASVQRIVAPTNAASTATPTANVREQSQQIQQQFKQQLESALQSPRAMPDDAN